MYLLHLSVGSFGGRTETGLEKMRRFGERVEENDLHAFGSGRCHGTEFLWGHVMKENKGSLGEERGLPELCGMLLAGLRVGEEVLPSLYGETG